MPPTRNDPPLFVFGTLMDAETLHFVLGRPVAPECVLPARLLGYQRRTIRGREYPMLVRRTDASVEGLVILNLDAADWRRLDAYEGPEYRQAAVTVIAPVGPLSARVFFCRKGVAHDGRPWSLEDWRAGRKGR